MSSGGSSGREFIPPRQRANTSNEANLTAKVIPLDQQIRTLINEKYTLEYKLDRRTRSKAEEILKSNTAL